MNHYLLGLYDSPYVRRVAIAMTYYEIPFDHESLSVFRHVEQMRKTNPLLRVPLLVTPEGDRLHESAFILDHLDELARLAGRQALIPASGPRRRRVWQMTALAQAATDKAVAINYEFRRPQELRWAELLDRLRGQMATGFQLLENMPQDDWLVDGQPSHADVMAAVAVSFVRFTAPHEWTPGRFPKLEALTRQLEETAAFKAVPIDESSRRAAGEISGRASGERRAISDDRHLRPGQNPRRSANVKR